MSLKSLTLSIAFGLLLLVSVGQSAIIVSVNVNPGSSTGAFAPGSVVTADVFLELSEATDSLGVYTFGVEYDQSELSYVGRQDFTFGALNERIANSPAEPLGRVSNINAYTLGAGQSGVFGPIRVASLTFNAINPNGGVGDLDLRPGFYDPGADGFFSSTFQDVTGSVTFNGASVTAVPEPASIAVLAIAGAAGTYYRRRRQNKVANQPQA